MGIVEMKWKLLFNAHNSERVRDKW